MLSAVCVAQAWPAPAATYTLTVTLAGTGHGTMTSTPAGISSSPTCTASFAAGTSVKLTASLASGSYFGGWSGACKGTSTCIVTMNNNLSVTATLNLPALTRRRADEHDGVLQLQYSAVDDSAQAASAECSGPCYLNQLP